jgi:hypothetical protein
LGISLAPSSKAARVQLAVAFPYGYNWPLVLGDLETALGRKVPHVVVFRDWSQGFPDWMHEKRARAAKLCKSPGNRGISPIPDAVNFRTSPAGRYDAYIDDWARGARSFGPGNLGALGPRNERQLVSVEFERQRSKLEVVDGRV